MFTYINVDVGRGVRRVSGVVHNLGYWFGSRHMIHCFKAFDEAVI